MPKPKSVRPRKGWVVVHRSALSPLLWDTKRQAEIWRDGEPNAYVTRATLTLNPDPVKPKRKGAA